MIATNKVKSQMMPFIILNPSCRIQYNSNRLPRRLYPF